MIKKRKTLKKTKRKYTKRKNKKDISVIESKPILPIKMERGHYLVSKKDRIVKIERVKKHSMYVDGFGYVLASAYGTKVGPYTRLELEALGFTEYTTRDVLNKRFNNGTLMLSDGLCIITKAKKKPKKSRKPRKKETKKRATYKKRKPKNI